MSDMPPSVVEQLRLALLGDLRTVADELHPISAGIEVELASPSPNLEQLQIRFLELAATIQTRIRLHERIGWPGEPITPTSLSFGDDDEKDLALDILSLYRNQLFARLISGSVEMNEKERLLDGMRLITDFFSVGAIDPQAAIEVRRIAEGRG